MPPKKVIIDADRIYRAGPPLRQKKFPERKNHVKTGRRSLPAAGAPNLQKQSTLTQRWSFDGEVLDLPENDDEIEDSEDGVYSAMEPVRKRRKILSSRKIKGASKRQNTMTQMGYVTSFGSINEDGDDNQALSDDLDEEEDERVPESVSSQDAMAALKGASRTSGERFGEAAETRLQPSPELSQPVEQPRTPRRQFPLEIPSSNTPQSAILMSLGSERSCRSPIVSPLNVHSANPAPSSPRPPLTPVQESQVVTAIPFSPWSVRKTPIFRVPEMPARKISTLKHQTTIPDSDDMPVEETQRPRTTAIGDLKRTHKARSSIIHDSQSGSLDQSVTESVDMREDRNLGNATNDEYQATLEYDFTQYDTVASALDRDAARYDQTQRLKNHQRTMRSDVVLDTQEGSAEDMVAANLQLLSTKKVLCSPQNRNLAGSLTLNRIHELEPSGETGSFKSESLPSTPDRTERLHHRPRFHDVNVVDLTADSFDPVISATSGSPTPKTRSQAPLDITRLIPSPSSTTHTRISSSPPLIPRYRVNEVGVEYLPLNDIEPAARKSKPSTIKKSRNVSQSDLQHNGSQNLNLGTAVPPSQVSTVGDPTQSRQSQRRRTQIKQEPEDLYSATPRALHDFTADIDLDQNNEDNCAEPSYFMKEPKLETVEHIDLSDQLDPSDYADNDYVDVDDIHRRYHIGEDVPMPSSPFPIAPGHEAMEYEHRSGDEISSELPAHVTSPPLDSSEINDEGSPSSNTSPAIHAHVQALKQENTFYARRISNVIMHDNVTEHQSTPRAPPPLSEKARGKQPLYAIDDSEDEAEQEEYQTQEWLNPTNAESYINPVGSSHHPHDEQYSWHFRPAKEIVPDTQYSIAIPPVPWSDD